MRASSSAIEHAPSNDKHISELLKNGHAVSTGIDWLHASCDAEVAYAAGVVERTERLKEWIRDNNKRTNAGILFTGAVLLRTPIADGEPFPGAESNRDGWSREANECMKRAAMSDNADDYGSWEQRARDVWGSMTWDQMYEHIRPPTAAEAEARLREMEEEGHMPAAVAAAIRGAGAAAPPPSTPAMPAPIDDDTPCMHWAYMGGGRHHLMRFTWTPAGELDPAATLLIGARERAYDNTPEVMFELHGAFFRERTPEHAQRFVVQLSRYLGVRVMHGHELVAWKSGRLDVRCDFHGDGLQLDDVLDGPPPSTWTMHRDPDSGEQQGYSCMPPTAAVKLRCYDKRRQQQSRELFTDATGWIRVEVQMNGDHMRDLANGSDGRRLSEVFRHWHAYATTGMLNRGWADVLSAPIFALHGQHYARVPAPRGETPIASLAAQAWGCMYALAERVGCSIVDVLRRFASPEVLVESVAVSITRQRARAGRLGITGGDSPQDTIGQRRWRELLEPLRSAASTP